MCLGCVCVCVWAVLCRSNVCVGVSESVCFSLAVPQEMHDDKNVAAISAHLASSPRMKLSFGLDYRY